MNFRDWWSANGTRNSFEHDRASEVWNAAIEEALRCYSPDDSATDWADKILALKS